MKVGMMLGAEFSLVSLVTIARNIWLGLTHAHEPVYLPHAYPYVTPAERNGMAEEFLRKCDVVAGLLDPTLLACRRRMGSDIPYLFFTHGDLPAGGWDVRAALPYLTTNDVMLVNCSAEVEIARLLLQNANVRVVPFAVGENFYALDEEERRAARARNRFSESDRIILYSGRVIPEKNVHALISLLEAVRAQVPRAHLVLAGAVGPSGKDLERYGVRSVSLPGTFARLIARSSAPERVHALGNVGAHRLRELYNIADVAVNLTLNPDENFGMSQVEAIACGTPVVGTAWGGLKDTVADGVSGYRVSTVPTATGVKFSWWEALNRIVLLLRDRPAREELRQRCREVAGRYSLEAMAAVLGEIVEAAGRGRGRPGEPLRATPFAEEFWAVCDPRWPGPPYRRGPQAEALHTALIAPFSAPSPLHVPAEEPLSPEDVLSLATPVHACGASVRPDDVFYPYEVPVPARYQEAVQALLEVLAEEPPSWRGSCRARGRSPRRRRRRPWRGWWRRGWCSGPGPRRGGWTRPWWTAGSPSPCSACSGWTSTPRTCSCSGRRRADFLLSLEPCIRRAPHLPRPMVRPYAKTENRARRSSPFFRVSA